MNSWKNKILTVLGLGSSLLALGQSISVNSTNYKQTIDMCGGDMERSSISIQSSTNKNEMIDWGFKDIAFNYCRIQYDKNQEMVEGTKNWAFYDKQVLTMQRVKLANPNIRFFATMRTDYDGFGNENNMPDWIVDYTTKKIDIDKYAIFLADYLEYMYNQGLPIHTMSITKEWTSFVYASRAKNIIPKLHAACDARGIPRVIISDQGFWSMKQGMSYMNDVATLGTVDLYDSFCTHDYDGSDTTSWTTVVAKANSLGKKMYDDETSTGAGAATSGVEPAISKPIGVYIDKCKSYQAGLSGEIFFEIWSRGINTETRSIYSPSKGAGTRLRGYYIMKQFANNVLDSKYITTTATSMSNVYTMTFRKGNQVMLWVINKGTTDYTAPITLDNSKYSGAITNYYWTDATTAEGLSTNYNSTTNSFSPFIKGESMNCFIFNVTDNSSCGVFNLPQTEAECYDDMFGVVKETCSEGGENLGSIGNNDWVKYTGLDLSGVYSFNARVASNNAAGGNIEVRLGSITGTLIATLPVSKTASWQSYETKSINLNYVNGVNDVFLVFKGGAGSLMNLNWFGFSDQVICNNTATRIEAECYTSMLGIQTEKCTEGTKNVGYINDGDWLAYTGMNLTGMKSVNVRYANNKATGVTMEIRTGSETGTLLATIPMSSTGGNQLWESKEISLASVTGTQNVYLVFKGGTGYLMNLNWLEFSNKIVTGVADLEQDTEVEIYPNPTTSTIMVIKQQNNYYSLYNQFNILVSKGEIQSEDFTIDLNNLPSGVYFLKVEGRNKTSIQKIVKQ